MDIGTIISNFANRLIDAIYSTPADSRLLYGLALYGAINIIFKLASSAFLGIGIGLQSLAHVWAIIKFTWRKGKL